MLLIKHVCSPFHPCPPEICKSWPPVIVDVTKTNKCDDVENPPANGNEPFASTRSIVSNNFVTYKTQPSNKIEHIQRCNLFCLFECRPGILLQIKHHQLFPAIEYRHTCTYAHVRACERGNGGGDGGDGGRGGGGV